MAEQDITKTGALTYRDLQNKNNNPEESSDLTKQLEQEKAWINSGQATPHAINSEYQSDVFKYAGNEAAAAGYGNSKYDKGITNFAQLNHLNDVRALTQSKLAKIGVSIAKAGVLTGTTFVDSTVGFVTGLAEIGLRATGAVKKDDGSRYNAGESISAIWDNDVSNGLNEVNQKMEEIAPYYKTEYSQSKAWYQHLGSLDFWADGILKNTGFMVGAFYGGAAWTKILKGMSLMKNSSTLAAKLVGSSFQAVNEGRIEANTNSYQMVQAGMREIQDGYNDREGQIMNSNLSEAEKNIQLEQLDKDYKEQVEQLKQDSRYMGNLDLLVNIPILLADNFFTFGKMYARGFGNAKNAAQNGIKKTITQAANEASSLDENFLNKGIKKAVNSGKYTWNKLGKKDALKRGLNIGLREGNEEMAQDFASDFAANKYSPDSPDAYYTSMIDPSSRQKAMSTLEAAIKGFASSYGNPDKYQDFAMGAISSLIGVPTFGRVNNADANTFLGKGKRIGLSGGLAGEFTTNKEQNKRGEENVKWMNKIQDRINKNINYMTQSEFFNNLMDGYAKENNKFEYLNMADNDTARGIQAFMSAGKTGDLKELVNQDFEHMPDEDLAKNAGYTTPEINNKKSLVGWKNAQGELQTNSKEGVEGMRKKLIKKREDILNDIDNFEKSLGIVRRTSNYSVNQSEEEVNELTWLLWKSNKFKDRVQEIKDDNYETFNLIYQRLGEHARDMENSLKLTDDLKINYDNLTSKQALNVEIANKKLKESKQADGNELSYTRYVMFTLKTLLESSKENMVDTGKIYGQNQSLLKTIRDNDELYNQYVKGTLTQNQFKTAIESLMDVGKLSNAYNTFMEKFNEYQKDPLKITKNRNHLKKAKEKVSEAINKHKNRKGAVNITRADVMTKSEDDIDDIFSKLNDENAADKKAKEIIEDGRKSKKFLNNAQIKLDRARQEAAKEKNANLDIYDNVQEIINNAGAKAESYAELADKANEIYLANNEGVDYTEEEIALVQDIVENIGKEISDADGLAAESAIDKAVKRERERKAKEEAERKKAQSTTTGEQEEPSPKKTNKTKEPRKAKKEPKKEPKKTEVPIKKAKAKSSSTTKKTKKVSKAELAKRKKNKDIENITEILSKVNDKSAPDLCKEMAIVIYNTINKDGIKNAKDVLDVIKESPEYEAIEKVEEPKLMAGIKTAFELLNKEEIYPEKSEKEEEENKEVDTVGSTIDTTKDSEFNYIVPPADSKVINPFRRATSEFGFGYNSSNEPYFKQFKKGSHRRFVLETLYNFMKNNGVFENQANVKEGDTIYFTTNNELNKKIGSTIILMASDPEGKNIVGDLINREDTSFASNKSLVEFSNRFRKKQEQWEHANPSKKDSEPFIYPATTKVAQTMFGGPKFNGSTSKKDDRTLNDLFNLKTQESKEKKNPFYLGVVGNKHEVLVEDSEIIKNIIAPKNPLTVGTPTVLVYAGDGTGKYFAVPFHMDTFNLGLKDSMLFRWISEQIAKKVNEYEGIKDSKETTESSINFKNLLSEFFVGDFHVNYNNKEDELEIHTGTRKDGNYTSLYDGKVDENTLNYILKSLSDNHTEIRINRKNINERVVTLNNGMKVSYNAMIGELAHNGLLKSTTANAYFTAYPLKTDDTILITNKELLKLKSSSSSNSNQGLYTSVKYKGIEYRISSNGDISNAKNKKLSDLSLQDKQIIKAKAEIDNTETLNYVSPSNSYWFVLRNSFLFYNKEGEEKVVSDKNKINEVIESLKKGKSKEDNIIDILSDIAYSEDNNDLIKNITRADNIIYKNKIVLDDAQKVVYEDAKNKLLDEGINLGTVLGSNYNPEINDAIYKNGAKEGDENLIITKIKQPALMDENEEVEARGLVEVSPANTVNNDVEIADLTDTKKKTPEVKDNNLESHKTEVAALGGTETKISVLKPDPDDNNDIFADNNNTIESAESKTDTKKIEPKYPKDFRTKKIREVFDGLTTQQKNILLKDAFEDRAANKEFVHELKKILVNKKGKAMLEKEIQKATKLRFGGSLREVNNTDVEKINMSREIEWLHKVLPQLSTQDRLRIHKGIIKIISNKNSIKAWGMFQNGVITISDAAVQGTAYHEAFHAVSSTILSDKERNTMYSEGSELYGIDRDIEFGDMEIEEKLAEDFRKYVEKERNSKSGFITRIFRTIKHIVQNLLGKEAYLNNLFYTINRGKFANKAIQEKIRNSVEDNEVTEYRESKTMYESIDSSLTEALASAGISEEQYNALTVNEKETLNRCIS